MSPWNKQYQVSQGEEKRTTTRFAGYMNALAIHHVSFVHTIGYRQGYDTAQTQHNTRPCTHTRANPQAATLCSLISSFPSSVALFATKQQYRNGRVSLTG